MIDIGGEYGSSGGNFSTDKLRSDVAFDAHCAGVVVLADSHILHLRSDNALFCQCHLCDFLALGGTSGRIAVGKTDIVEHGVFLAHTSVVGSDVGELLEVVALGYEGLACAWQTFVDVDFDIGVGVDSAGVVDVDGSIFGDDFFSVDYIDCRSEVDPTHSYLDRKHFAVYVYLFRTGIRVYVNVFDFHL